MPAHRTALTAARPGRYVQGVFFPRPDLSMPPPTALPRQPADRSPARPFRAFGWSLAGVIGLSLSFPPVGFYPLAWIGLVPLLVRWSEHETAAACARETYALFLTLTACTGFWLLFHRDTTLALAGGFGILAAPLPLTAAFTAAGLVRRRFGLVLGLAALVLGIVATEFLLLQGSVGVPWLLLAHTQVEALPFIQTADLGGALLLSLWVLLLNVTAFAALPAVAERGAWAERIGESGIAVALFAVLLALPAAYGAARAAWSETPAAYTRVGIIQPGLPPETWDGDGPGHVDLLADLSDRLLGRWTDTDSVRATGDGTALVRAVALRPPAQDASGETVGLLVWPQGALPYMGSPEREAAAIGRIETWCRLRNVALITGATTHSVSTDDETTSALLVTPGATALRYDQMRRVPVADAPSALGDRRMVFPVGGARVATLLGFESLFGDHVRRFAGGGADLYVVLAQSDRWGRSSGPYQHLLATRLRAIETRRAVVMTSAGGVSALIHPSGQIDEATGWMEQGLVPLDVPSYRAETVYARRGDWVGRWALSGAVLLYLVAGGMAYARPVKPARKPKRA